MKYFTFRKTILPFSTVEDMFANTPFRLAMIPDTSYVDNFKYAPNPTWKAIFEERIEPNLQEYRDYSDHLTNMIHFIENDFATALWDGYVPIK